MDTLASDLVIHKNCQCFTQKNNNKFYHWHFLPFRRADLTPSASLQGIRGEGPQLHTLCLASAVTSTRE
jgi:hypothetical protein